MNRPRISTFGAAGTPAANCTYKYAAGVSGTFTLPDFDYLVSLSCWASQAGATVQVNGGAVINVPDSGTFEMSPNGGIVGADTGSGQAATTIVFTGTSGYCVEYLD
jgi:hypothetical protein